VLGTTTFPVVTIVGHHTNALKHHLSALMAQLKRGGTATTR
jgi:hypothetical protein